MTESKFAGRKSSSNPHNESYTKHHLSPRPQFESSFPATSQTPWSPTPYSQGQPSSHGVVCGANRTRISTSWLFGDPLPHTTHRSIITTFCNLNKHFKGEQRHNQNKHKYMSIKSYEECGKGLQAKCDIEPCSHKSIRHKSCTLAGFEWD